MKGKIPETLTKEDKKTRAILRKMEPFILKTNEKKDMNINTLTK